MTVSYKRFKREVLLGQAVLLIVAVVASVLVHPLTGVLFALGFYVGMLHIERVNSALEADWADYTTAGGV